MEDFTADDSEHLIEAVASGAVPSAHGDLADALAELHRPLPPATTAAPAVGGAGSGTTGRFARRTAVAAGLSVFSLVGVAAAGTAGVALLLDEPTAVIEEADAQDTSTSTSTTSTTSTSTTSTTSTSTTSSTSVPAADSPDEERERGDAIVGVDPSDGLDDDELALLCEAAVNHGEYVSSVARDKREGEIHGERVREAAQSDCGRNDDDEDERDEDERDEADEDERDDDERDDDERDEDGRGNGNGNGRGDGDSDETNAGGGSDEGGDEEEDGPGNNGRGNAHGHDKRKG